MSHLIFQPTHKIQWIVVFPTHANLQPITIDIECVDGPILTLNGCSHHILFMKYIGFCNVMVISIGKKRTCMLNCQSIGVFS